MLTRPVTRARQLLRGLRLGRDEAANLVRIGYRIILKRDADPQGEADFVAALRSGRVSPSEFLFRLASSPEANAVADKRAALYPTLGHALHAARCEMVRQLPEAARIVDLGGGAEGDSRGALVIMGYPYRFDRLTIVEPPKPDRHDLYLGVAPGDPDVIDTGRGVVEYLYTSMADLSAVPSGSVDLVFSGESIEHVTRADCERVLAEARRVLKPDGWFCFDTPNRAVTRLQVGDEQFINPDHKHEYTHAEMAGLLTKHRFEVVEAKGISWMPVSALTGLFDASEMAVNVGLYDDIEASYLLYYRCRPK
jgi:SAM-dependent methyltransferase